MAEQASSDWIEHDGAGCPVSDSTYVQVWFRSDRDERAAVRSNHTEGVPASRMGCCWNHQDAYSDIVKYRVVA